MSCEEVRLQIHGYLDGELDPVKSGEIERHFHDCPACRRAFEAQRALSAAVRAKVSYFAAPKGLEERIRASLPVSAEREPRRLTVQWSWLGLGASLAFAVMLSWNLAFEPALRQGDRLTEEVIADHVRSLMASHLTDVASSDQHTVKPWFDGKLDFSPPVKDLTGQGFPLVGGRLEYLDGRAVAALVYRHRLHYINVFIWPEPQARDTAPLTLSRQGFNLVRFNRVGMAYWVVSDLNAGELGQFVGLLRG